MLKEIAHIIEAAPVKKTKVEHYKYNQSLIFVKYYHAPSNMLNILHVLCHSILTNLIEGWKQLDNSHKTIYVAQEEQEVKLRFIWC